MKKIYHYLSFPSRFLTGLFFFGIIMLFLHYKEISSTPEGIGSILTGIAALLALEQINSFWNQKRQESSSKILSAFNLHINNIIEIISKNHLYQYEGYYPFSYPEIRNFNQNNYPERPIRLINNEFGNLRKEYNIYLSFIGSCETMELLKIEGDLHNTLNQISAKLQAELGDHPEKKLIAEKYPPFDEYKQQLIKILNRVENLILPVIRK